MTDDTNDRFEALLRDAAATYNRPPDERKMPLEAMWAAVEAEAFPNAGATRVTPLALLRSRATARLARPGVWRIAAALLIGIGIGRLSFSFGAGRAAPSGVPVTAVPSTAIASDSAQPYDAATSRYLGQAAALLIALPTETNTGRPDERFLMRANELLLTTRLLLDSPTASEQGLRNLLEDLELVLVQVVRLEHERDRTRRTELELIQQALDQRDVLPRLRTAVSEHAAD